MRWTEQKFWSDQSHRSIRILMFPRSAWTIICFNYRQKLDNIYALHEFHSVITVISHTTSKWYHRKDEETKTVRSCVVYCSYFCDGSSQYLLDALDRSLWSVIYIKKKERGCNTLSTYKMMHETVECIRNGICSIIDVLEMVEMLMNTISSLCKLFICWIGSQLTTL